LLLLLIFILFQLFDREERPYGGHKNAVLYSLKNNRIVGMEYYCRQLKEEKKYKND
jgi:hypothetical protein